MTGYVEPAPHEFAAVSLRSCHVAELVHDAVKEAQEAVKRAAETGAKAIRAAEQGMVETMNVFIAWAARHDIDVDDALNWREASMKLRIGAPGREARRAIKEGFRIWKEANLPEQRFRMARIQFSDGGVSDAWRYLNAGQRQVREWPRYLSTSFAEYFADNSPANSLFWQIVTSNGLLQEDRPAGIQPRGF